MSKLVDPLISFTRTPTPEEEYTLYSVLSRLLVIARKERAYTAHIEAPAEWRIMERLGLGHGFALGRYGVVYRTALDSQYLPAVMAHIIGWYNKPDKIQPAYEILEVRDMAASFQYERLPSYTKDTDEWIPQFRPVYEVINYVLKEHHRPEFINSHTHSSLKPSGLPEQLRPKPVDVVLGGGNNYAAFGYRSAESYSGEYSEQKEDNARGLIAVMEYLEAIKFEATENRVANFNMWRYFKHRQEHAEYFKKAQRFADGYAQIVFGMAGQLAELLKRHEMLSQADGQQTIHFYQSLPVRIAYLRKLSSLLV
jgi:hypothetical protein